MLDDIAGLSSSGARTWLQFNRSTRDAGAGVDATATSVGVAPSIDLFVSDRVSIGGSAFVSATWNDYSIPSDPSNDWTMWSFAVTPRVGYFIPLGEHLALWPKVGAGVAYSDLGSKMPGGAASGLSLRMETEVPLVLRVHPNAFIKVGPRLGGSIRLAHDGSEVAFTAPPRDAIDLGFGGAIGLAF